MVDPNKECGFFASYIYVHITNISEMFRDFRDSENTETTQRQPML